MELQTHAQRDKHTQTQTHTEREAHNAADVVSPGDEQVECVHERHDPHAEVEPQHRTATQKHDTQRRW